MGLRERYTANKNLNKEQESNRTCSMAEIGEKGCAECNAYLGLKLPFV